VRVVLWDFDGTLAFREGMWAGCLAEVLDEHEPGHGRSANDFRPALRGGFPWHRADLPHPELSDPDAWWAPVTALVARAYVQAGYDEARAGQLAHYARSRYADPAVGWKLFDDTVPTLERLRGDGWRHVVLSNHVPELSAIVDGLGLAPLLDAIVNSAVTGYEKPHPEAFAHARHAAGDAESIWMVGDNVAADVEGAEAAGIPAILVRRDAPPGVRAAPTLAAAADLISRDTARRRSSR